MELTPLLCCFVIAVATLLLLRIKAKLNYWKKQNVPHEEPSFFKGNLKGLQTTRQFGELLADYYEKFKSTGKPFAGFYLMQRPCVVPLNTQIIKQILIKDFNNFTDHGMYSNARDDPLTGHLGFLDGEQWRRLRTKLTPSFTSLKMKSMLPTMLCVTDEFMSVLSKNMKEQQSLDIRDLLTRFTVDIIGTVAFGIECNSLKNPQAEFLIMGRRAMQTRRHKPLVMALIEAFPDLALQLGMRVLPEDVHQFFMQSIRETVKYREENNIQRNDFLNMLIELKNNASPKEAISFEELAAQAFVFYMGGFETTSMTMTYALYELAQHEHIQNRLREELMQEVFGNGKQIKDVSYDKLMSLGYMEQVILETLRKYPIVPHLNRIALSDYQVPNEPEQFVIKKGMRILIPVLGIHHDPSIYAEPQNFDPERFSNPLTKRDSIELLAFGEGPRNCIGMRFAKMLVRLGLACILQRFRIRLCESTYVPLLFDPKVSSLSPRKPIYVKLEEI